MRKDRKLRRASAVKRLKISKYIPDQTCTTGKTAYSSPQKAHAASAQLSKYANAARRGTAYQCSRCNAWHITRGEHR